MNRDLEMPTDALCLIPFSPGPRDVRDISSEIRQLLLRIGSDQTGVDSATAHRGQRDIALKMDPDAFLQAVAKSS